MLALGILGAAGPPAPGATAPAWQDGGWSGIPRAQLTPAGAEAVAISARGQGGFVWRHERRAAECVSWRWRVDHGPPATRLDRRGGDDRALAVTIGFAGWPARSSAWQRTQHAVAQANAGGRPLPRAALVFVWGGTGEEPRGFESPYMAGLGRVFVLRAAEARRGVWKEERVDLRALWRETFGGQAPPVDKIAISVDSDDTGSRVEARIDAIRFGPCEPSS
ncbi:DUF3047 domain-containing protein [Roseomonas sp. CECT 9278]|uniref:DUF3047 domain-containing protein n=1 Tax=Roseomonas sp. CECT 9278 TaxID=2845823 RepID=UPI001E37F795|nr:DUF3047 domain-containing protein [Roseomonas sp. CECT 9278]